MLRQLRPALIGVLAFALLTGLIFPAIVTVLARAAFPRQAGGSLITDGGRIVGSGLIGQSFTSARYFHPRPSAAGKGYDALASGGSNLGPVNPKLMAEVSALSEAYRDENGLPLNTPLPADAVTGSASGLDPDISPANADLQAARVAKARGLDVLVVRRLIRRNTQGRQFGILGEPRVNVLTLNRSLDAISHR